MADIANNVSGATNFITDIILWISTAFANLVKNIGFTEIIIFLVIVFCIYMWANQHNIQPKRISRI